MITSQCICFKCASGNYSMVMCDKHADEYILYKQKMVAKYGWHTSLLLDCKEWFEQQYMYDFGL